MNRFPVSLLIAFAMVAAAPLCGATGSRQIDALLAAEQARAGVTPNPPARDSIFLRRAYLDIAGRIPTRTEALAFLESNDPGKREQLIDTLLEGEGYTQHFFNFWADLLRVNRIANNGQFVAPFYSDWIKDALREDKPYDLMVRELLTTDGAAWDSGAIGYYMRDRGMPLDNMSNTVRIFLGTRLECAQCHDHPFDQWTQMDYYKMAAFSYDMQANYRSPILESIGSEMRREGRRPAGHEQQALRAAFQETMRPLRYTAIVHEDRTLRLPDDYGYDNGRPGQPVEPATLFGGPAPSASLDGYAAWLTSKENPRFTTVIANRLWKKVFGLGLIEPVDEITASTKASHPELMAFLEDRMRDFDYDLKAFLAMLYKTEAYQRAATPEEVFPGDPYHFQGPLLRRMSAEQIWDSFVTLINPSPDTEPEIRQSQRDDQLVTVQKIHESVYALPTADLVTGLKAVAAAALEGTERTRELTEQIAEARENKDEDAVRSLSRDADRYRSNVRVKVVEEIYQPGWEELVRSGRAEDLFGPEIAAQPFAGGRGAARDTMAMMDRAGGGLSRADRAAEMERYRNMAREFGVSDRAEYQKFVEFMTGITTQAQRAAILPQPAPPGHFLREFGQSDRDVIDNASAEASLPQALQLLNGPYAEALVNQYGVLTRAVLAESTTRGRLEVLYLSLYARYPTPEELAYFEGLLAELGDEAYKDLVYAILNTQQFLFIQ